MDITPAPTKDMHIIQSYGAGRFVINEQEIAQNVLVWPAGLQLMGSGTLEELDAPSIADIIQPLPELVIVGTGQWMLPIPKHIKEEMKNQQVTCEPMDTGAACRTYNVLVQEDRRVAALLMLV